MLVRLYDFHPFPPRNHALRFLRKFFPLRLPSAVPVFDICKIDLFFHGFSPSPLSYSYYTTSGAVVQVFNQWFLGGKKTASSLARQRLMRGDNFPQFIAKQYALCFIKIIKHRLTNTVERCYNIGADKRKRVCQGIRESTDFPKLAAVSSLRKWTFGHDGESKRHFLMSSLRIKGGGRWYTW